MLPGWRFRGPRSNLWILHRSMTSPVYRFYALAGGPPKRPGLIHDSQNGASVAVEIWSLPLAELDGFLQAIPAPLGIGSVELSDGTTVKGFVCEAYGVEDGQDITHLADWRQDLSRLEQQDDWS